MFDILHERKEQLAELANMNELVRDAINLIADDKGYILGLALHDQMHFIQAERDAHRMGGAIDQQDIHTAVVKAMLDDLHSGKITEYDIIAESDRLHNLGGALDTVGHLLRKNTEAFETRLKAEGLKDDFDHEIAADVALAERVAKHLSGSTQDMLTEGRAAAVENQIKDFKIKRYASMDGADLSKVIGSAKPTAEVVAGTQDAHAITKNIGQSLA